MTHKQESKRIKFEDKRRYLIRVYRGRLTDSHQGGSFTSALSEFQQEYQHILFQVEYLNCTQLKNNLVSQVSNSSTG